MGGMGVVAQENLTMPKLIIDSTGDEFFMPDGAPACRSGTRVCVCV